MGQVAPIFGDCEKNRNFVKRDPRDFKVLLDSFARFQRTDGAFNSIDPKAENYFHISPYAYCAGNPIINIDPLGYSDWKIVGKGGIALVSGVTSLMFAYGAPPLAPYFATQGISSVAFGISYIAIGLLSEPADRETIQEIPTSMMDLGAIIIDDAMNNKNDEARKCVNGLLLFQSIPTSLPEFMMWTPQYIDYLSEIARDIDTPPLDITHYDKENDTDDRDLE